MTIQRMDHVGVNVRDLAAARAFFLDLGLEVAGEGALEGEWLDRIVALEGARTGFVMLRTPNGQSTVELITYHAPADEIAVVPLAVNAHGIRHIAFVVDDVETTLTTAGRNGAEPVGEILHLEPGVKLCYIRGPEGLIVELAEQSG